ncbi:TolC family protein [soil metagenome]
MTVVKFTCIASCMLLLLLSNINSAYSQTEAQKTLTVSEFIEIVKQYHPLAKQANLLSKEAQAQLLIAQSGWDPKIYSNYTNKTFDGNNYYSYFENKLSIPTWYGVDLYAGYDFSEGKYLNPENTLPNDGLGYIGISIPLARNLVLDKQRASLKQARIFRESNEQERILQLNDLLLSALTAYAEWSYAYNEYSVYKEAVRVAKLRFDATKVTVEYGDRSAIDTVEALTQLQQRKFQYNEALLHFWNTGLEVSNYLWLENDLPRGIDTTIIPNAILPVNLNDEIKLSKLEELSEQLKLSHPALLNYNFKLNQLNIERKLKIESLKPLLNFNYNLLLEDFKFQSNPEPIYTNNYKLGINFTMPLTFMQGRGELKLTNLKIQETKLAFDYKQQELLNKLKTYYNELVILKQQIQLYEETIKSFKQLLDGETARLSNGESSLFLVNTRENRYLESQIKLSELQSKYFKTEASYKWTIGTIYK